MDAAQVKQILTKVDHTLLRVDSRWEEIQEVLDDAMRYETASACIPPSFVERAEAYVDGRLPICTVIGFPNGYATTATKCFEASDAVAKGASEIDMVVNVGWVKEGRFDDILDEIDQVKSACQGRLLKVIIESCLLTDQEMISMCQVVSKSKAEYIKTSTGFSKAGATFEDIKLFSEHIGPNVKMKAAGGISSLDDAEKFLSLGADRLGTSRIVKIVKQEEATGY